MSWPCPEVQATMFSCLHAWSLQVADAQVPLEEKVPQSSSLLNAHNGIGCAMAALGCPSGHQQWSVVMNCAAAPTHKHVCLTIMSCPLPAVLVDTSWVAAGLMIGKSLGRESMQSYMLQVIAILCECSALCGACSRGCAIIRLKVVPPASRTKCTFLIC